MRCSIWFSALLIGMAGTAAAQGPVLHTGFEGLPAGGFNSIETQAGRWSASKGHALIDTAHQRGGSQCLHIVGGEARQVILDLPTTEAPVDELTFWCERWTQRDPFEFRIERFAHGAWLEIYRGDKEVLIGTFKNYVRVPLSEAPSRLRFTCTSPAGILIDDLDLRRATPMRLASVTTTQPVVPCLVDNAVNRVALLQIETAGGLEPILIQKIHVNLDGTTDLRNLAHVEVLGPDGTRFGEAQAPARKLVFRGEVSLLEGRNTFAISATLTAEANIEHVVDAGCDSVKFSEIGRVTPQTTRPRGAQRCGIALRDAGDDGSAAYRIPGITTTNAGTLIAVYDIRWRGGGDLPGDIDVGMSRSVDGGRSWEPMKTILDMGDNPKFRHDGVGDPSILYDRVNEVIWVAATWSHGNRAWRGSGPGLEPHETGQLMLTRSNDDGQTWSKAINITQQVKRPEWCYLLQGPGRGICMDDGTLVFAAQYQDTEERGRIPHSTILYSRDSGESWELGTGPKSNTTEAQVVELAEGELMLNMRDNRGGSRSVFTTRDMGRTWEEHPTSRSALVEPVCNAALVRVSGQQLLFVNPAVSDRPRRMMTIKLSPDQGATWPNDQQLLLDSGSCAGYPSATMIDDKYVGVLFEGSAAQITFMRVPLAEIRR